MSMTGITTTIAVLIEAELRLAELYTVCARKFPEDRIFWETIANDERQHAAYLVTMQAHVAAQPSAFAPGRPLNASAIRTTIAYYESLIGKLESGALDAQTMYNVARDIERSVLETKYPELVRTQHHDYLALVARIARDTERHRELFQLKSGQPPTAKR